MTEMEQACIAWNEAKDAEKHAVENRRQIEDWMARQLSVADDFEGSKSVDIGDFKVKLTGRMTRKVDEKMIIAIANEVPKCCHLCFYYSEHGLCTVFGTEPPEDFARTIGVCEKWESNDGVPF